MRKTLIAAAVIAAGAYGAYYYSQQTQSDTAELLAQVPADTVFFSGQFNPINIVDYFKATSMMTEAQLKQVRDDLQSQLENEFDVNGEDSPGLRFVVQLVDEFLAAMLEQERFSELTGLSENARTLMYHVGAMPVLRWQLDDAAGFAAMLDRAEQKSGYSHTMRDVDGVAVRAYRIGDSEEYAEVLVRAEQQWATIVINSHIADATHLPEALALVKPALSLADTGYVEAVSKRYDLRPDGVAFVDSKRLVELFTQPQSSRLGQAIQAQLDAEELAAMATWQTPECAADLDRIATAFPGLYSDMEYQLDGTDSFELSTRSVIAIADPKALELATGLQGFIPALARVGDDDRVMMSFGLGSDIGRLGVSVSNIWSSIANVDFSCADLQQLQAEMKTTNPAAMLGALALGNGVQGAAVAVNEIDAERLSKGDFSNFDALMSISSDDVEALYSVLQASFPPLANQPLPAVGDAVSLRDVVAATLGEPLDLFLQRGESTLALYFGAIAAEQANQVVAEPMANNGLFAVNVHYAKLFEFMLAEAMLSGEPIDPAMEGFAEMNMRARIGMAFSQYGMEIDYTIESAAPVAQSTASQ